MVMDHLTKEHVCIICLNKDKKASAEATAKMLLHNVWRKCGLITSIMSNQRFQFVLAMWKTLCKILQINTKLATAFHLETASQSKIANQEMERHLGTYVNHFQNNWVDLLLIAKFAANANPSASTKIPPFQVMRKYVPKMNFNPVDLLKESTRKKLANSKTQSIAANIEKI